MIKKLTELNRFEVGILKKINSSEAMLERFTKLGFVENSELQVVSKLPFKGPLTIRIQGSKIAIRYIDAFCIEVELKEDKDNKN